MRARSVLCVVSGASLLLGLAASPASAAPSGKGRCISELAQAGLIGREVNPGRANIVAGTEGNDVFDSMLTDGVDIICGFGGNDSIDVLDAGDVFLGGAGQDRVRVNSGTFVGGEGDDSVTINNGAALGGNTGTFIGGEGNDFTLNNFGIFNGGPGDDLVDTNEEGGVFNGEEGDDLVFGNEGTFNGGPGDDTVFFNDPGGVFNGGPGNDTVEFDFGGEFNQ